MAKKNSSESITSAPTKSHSWLRDLIDYLHHLIITISSKLHHSKMQRAPMGDAKGDYDIWDKLGNHLEQVPVLEEHDTKPKPRVIPKRAQKGRTRPVVVANEAMPTGAELNELREHNRNKAAHQQQPHIRDQLQSKTMEHINIALILAAEGNQDGMKLHIDLANSAMQTASRFMSHEDYRVFEAKVESRVRSIIEKDHHDDPAQQ